MIYSYMTMKHPVVTYTLSKIDIVEVKLTGNMFHILLSVIYNSFRDDNSIFNFQYVSYRYLPSVVILLMLKKKYTVSLWGSDYYKSHGIRKYINEFILKRAENVSIATRTSKDFMMNEYKDVDLRILPFLLPNLEEIHCRESESQRVTILCGTNGSSNQQFDIIISALKLIDEELKDKFTFVFHLSYGLDEYTEQQINEFISGTDLDVKVVYDFLSGNDLIKFRAGFDVLIQIQKTDQLSAAMFEHLVQNKLVITGDWLPYSDLIQHGIYFETLSINNTSLGLVKVLNGFLRSRDEYSKKCKLNREIIIANYGLKTGIEKWKSFLQGV